jgi:hypothetical protein
MDDDGVEELRYFQRHLCRMYAAMTPTPMSCVFIECVDNRARRRQEHTYIECVAVPTNRLSDVRAYFKKAIDECDQTWTQHRKLIDTATRPSQRAAAAAGGAAASGGASGGGGGGASATTNDKQKGGGGGGLRHNVPEGFAYFHVEFGMEYGYAHVIESDAHFSRHFGLEVLCGADDVIDDCEPFAFIERQRPLSDEQQRRRVTQFRRSWHRYDWTRRLAANATAATATATATSRQ